MIDTKATARGEAGSTFANAADQAQYLALLQQENAEYEKVCATVFGDRKH